MYLSGCKQIHRLGIVIPPRHECLNSCPIWAVFKAQNRQVTEFPSPSDTGWGNTRREQSPFQRCAHQPRCGRRDTQVRAIAYAYHRHGEQRFENGGCTLSRALGRGSSFLTPSGQRHSLLRGGAFRGLPKSKPHLTKHRTVTGRNCADRKARRAAVDPERSPTQASSAVQRPKGRASCLKSVSVAQGALSLIVVWDRALHAGQTPPSAD